MYAHWGHFEHLADISVRGYGDNQAQSAQAALALTAIVTALNCVRPDVRVDVTCEDPEPEYLFVAWLNTVVFEMSTRRMLFGRFEVSINGARFNATMFGEQVSRARHRPAVEVKGATLTDLAVHVLPADGWLAQCVGDV